MSLQTHSHTRRNLLTGDWVLVSPHRTERPWQGQVEPENADDSPEYEPECYLCPGNLRAGGVRNPSYTGTFVFDNDYPALSGDRGEADDAGPLFQSRPEKGYCRVVCFSEKHNLCLADMARNQIERALHALFAQFRQLDAAPGIGYVQIFENRGQMMGCSNSHPHGQIWATEELPLEPFKELRAQRDYRKTNGSSLLMDYLQAELEDDVRVVCGNDQFVAVVPFWAVWPFETLVIPRKRIAGPDEMTDDDVAGFADILKRVLSRYDHLFETSTPYSMGFHPRPSDGEDHDEWQFHAHVFPPLLRSATIRKHLVGYEMLATPQRDLTPEVAAENLRSAKE